MRFGLALPQYDFSLPRGEPISHRALLEHAREAERMGFDSVWVSDHLFYSLARYGEGDRKLGALEPMTALAALAAATERVRLGSLVLCAGFRHPAVVAKMATTIDLLSAGRLDLGIGAGWYREEHEAFGYGFPTTGERFEVLEETLQVLRLLFAEGPADFEGKRFRLQTAHNQPLPIQEGGPPIWLGAKGGDRALRLAARLAAGWNTVWRWSVAAYAERSAAADRACEDAGRDPATLRRSIGLYAILGEDEADLRSRFEAMRAFRPSALASETLESFAADTLTGTAEQVLERTRAFGELGVEELIVSPGPLPFAAPDPSMLGLFAEAVMAPAGSL